MLYEDYLQSGECWLNSTLVVNMNRNHNQKRRGRHTMMPFWQVKEKFGQAIGQQIYQDKQAMERSKKPGDANIYFMEHPECKGQNETCRLLIILCIFLYPALLCWVSFYPIYPNFSCSCCVGWGMDASPNLGCHGVRRWAQWIHFSGTWSQGWDWCAADWSAAVTGPLTSKWLWSYVGSFRP